jgi:hypothetical protein
LEGKSVEDMVTFGPMAQAMVVMMFLWHVNGMLMHDTLQKLAK